MSVNELFSQFSQCESAELLYLFMHNHIYYWTILWIPRWDLYMHVCCYLKPFWCLFAEVRTQTSHAKLIFVYIGWNTTFELFYNRAFNMFMFLVHAGCLFLMLDMQLCVMHRNDGRRSVHLSLSYDMHLENIHILTQSGLARVDWRPFECNADGSEYKWTLFVNNPHWLGVCCMELFWSAFITWISSIWGVYRDALKKISFILLHATIHRSSWF